MHASSLENMAKCYRRYIADRPIETEAGITVLDVGGADVNGSYREVFARDSFRYVSADMTGGPGVDLVLTDPYHIPLADGSVDIVLSGQMLEHCEFFWRAFDEMMRVVKPEGVVFLIVPSGGPIHRYPVDCYRFYPDSLAALARHAGCTLVESWHDERGPWRDLVGVFRRAGAPPLPPRRPPPEAVGEPWSGPTGSAEEERVAGKARYLDVLARLHRELAPKRYLEIGVRNGDSLALATGPALGVDPAPNLSRALGAETRLVRATSDEFFESPTAAASCDLAFVDGMHLFEFALRDFMNVERHALAGAVCILDDILPNHPAQAQRERRTRAWTGDVWKLPALLARHRPDLFLLALDTAPTGLMLIAGLDPTSRALWNQYNPLVKQFSARPGPPAELLERHGAVDPNGPEFARVIEALKLARAAPSMPRDLVARLRRALAG